MISIRKSYMLIALAGAVLMASCQSDGFAWNDRPDYQRIVDTHYSPKVREALLPEATQQAKVLYMGADAQWDYIAHFISGYESAAKETGGRTYIGDGKGATQKGFDAGVRYYGQRSDLSLTDFGYSPIEATGTYTRTHFEESAFRPDDSGEKWWAVFQDDAWQSFRPEPPHSIYVEGFRCSIHGFLHPQEGLMGHMNFYDREVVVVGVTPAPN